MTLQHTRKEVLSVVHDNLNSGSESAGSNLARHSKETFGSVSGDARTFQEQMLDNSGLPVLAPESNRYARSAGPYGPRQSNAVLPTVAQDALNTREIHENTTFRSLSSKALSMPLEARDPRTTAMPFPAFATTWRLSELIENKWTVSGTVHTSRWMLQDLVQHIETLAAAQCRDRDGESAAETAGLTWTSLLSQLWVLMSARLERHEQRCSSLQRARSKAVAGELLLGRSPSSARLPRWCRLTSRGILLPSRSSRTTAGGEDRK